MEKSTEAIDSDKAVATADVNKYKSIGGWLWLPVIGLVLTPLIGLFVIFGSLLPVFDEGQWAALTTPGMPMYHPNWAPLLEMELIGNSLIVIFSVVLVIMFFKRKKSVPKWFIIYLASRTLFATVDYFYADTIPYIAQQDDTQATKQLVIAYISCLIWIPYFLKSERVKKTFIE